MPDALFTFDLLDQILLVALVVSWVEMLHIPAGHVLNEMLSLQQFTGACLSEGETGHEPTLVVN